MRPRFPSFSFPLTAVVFLGTLLLFASVLVSRPAQASSSLPDWSQAGYRGTGSLPSSGDITSNNTCIITTAEIQASPYNVTPNDGNDDSAGIQAAIDAIRNNCAGSFTNLSLIELPAGTLNISTEIHVDADYVVLRGQGNDPTSSGATKIEFQPGSDTVYDGIVDFDLNGMSDSGGGNGGWIWPGRGAFRVQSRTVHSSYDTAYNNAPANRKDFYEGSVNFHWKGGIELTQNSLVGDTVLELASVGTVSVGDYVWVGAANSHKMYDEQGVLNGDRIRGHMRQQIFVVTAVDSGNKTITIDKPLEFDLYINSTADGSSEISGSGSANKSKVIPLDVVEGVGFENFYLTQIVPGHTPSEADFNYNNIAKEQAMHGFVFKWAVNSYTKNIRTYMTGSHPIVTEMAKNLQFENNYLDGAWNKGKGGNGYFRNSKLWDSIIKNNTTRHLRHLTLQWSASGNVLTGNDIDSDLNLHGGWERYNLIENNTVNIPFNHRDCNPNCGSGDGTWYPIWWAAGEHAGGWAGATGPRNVFFKNTLRKQLTAGGSYTEYTPYSPSNNTIYQFGWDSNSAGGSVWQHLALNGTNIDTWTHNETVAFYASPHDGINDDCTYSSGSLVGASMTCNGVAQPTSTPTTPAGPTATPAPSNVIAQDDFESGTSSGGTGWSGAWSHSGDSEVYSGASPYGGSYHLRVRRNDGTAVRTVNLSGVSNARLQFWWKADSLENGETGTVEVYDGSWHTVLTVNNGQDDNSYHYADIDLAGYSMVSNFQVRVSANTSGSGDRFYVDEVHFVAGSGGGNPTATPPAPTATAPAPTATSPAPTAVPPTPTPPPSGSADVAVQAKITKDETSKAQYDVKLLNNGSSAFSGYKFRFYIDISEVLSAGYSANDLRCDENYDQAGAASCSFYQYSGNVYYAEVDFGSYALPANDDVRYKFTIRLNNWSSNISSSNDYSRQGLSGSYQTTINIPVYQGGALVTGTNP